MILLNGEKIEPTIFPDGTSQVTGLCSLISMHNEILFEFEKESEIIQLLQILDYCEHSYNIKGFNARVVLQMPFMPYGRQDKKLNEDYFAKSTFSRILDNFLCIEHIESLDMHSNDNDPKKLQDIFPTAAIRNAMIESQPTMICYPDRGAKSRYQSNPIMEGFSNVSMEKTRDQKTGYIKDLSFYESHVDVTGEKILIIDDICDGGMTFKLTAEKLLELGAKEVHLYTTHGIYSKGIQTLRDSGISRIFNRKGEVK